VVSGDPLDPLAAVAAALGACVMLDTETRVWPYWCIPHSFVKHRTPDCAMLRRSRNVKRVEALRPPRGYDACRICCHLPSQGSRPGLRWPA
jgi:hypothetical protein